MKTQLDIFETIVWVDSKNGAVDLGLLIPEAQPYREILSDGDASYAFNTHEKFFLPQRLRNFSVALSKWRETSSIKLSADIPIFFDAALSSQTFSVNLKFLAIILKLVDEMDVSVYMSENIPTS